MYKIVLIGASLGGFALSIWWIVWRYRAKEYDFPLKGHVYNIPGVMRLMYAYGTRSTVAILRIPRRVTELRLKLGTTGFVCELPLVTKMQRARLSKFTAACEEHGADFEIVEADGVASTLRLRLIASEGAEEAM